MYHDVRPRPVPTFERWSVTAERLRDHLETFLSAGFTPLTTAAAEADLAGEGERFAITFDDALTSFAEHATPVLRDLGLPATVFAPTAFVGATARWLDGPARELPLLDWPALRDLAAAGDVTIGGHGHAHLALDHARGPALTEDLDTSRSLIQDRLGPSASTSMAFPFGAHDRASRAAAAAAGFGAAYAIGEVPATASTRPSAIPRITASQELSGRELVDVARSRAQGAARAHRILRARIYRASRAVTRRRSGSPRPVERAAGA